MKTVKATSAFAVDGVVVRAGETRRLDDRTASDLIRRGKAVSSAAVAEPRDDADGAPAAEKPRRSARKDDAG